MARLLAPIALALALVACVTPPTQRFPPGTASSAVMQGMGRPSAEHRLPDGGRRIEYNGGAYGRRTWMFDFDASDRLVRGEQVWDEPHFNTIKAGMNAEDVRTRIGGPSTTWPIGWQRQIVWSYRYDTPFCQWFMVGMGPGNTVVDTAYGPDPLCSRDNIRDSLAMRRR
jgi:hypothetical protein